MKLFSLAWWAAVGPLSVAAGLGAGMVVAPTGIPGYIAGPFRGALADDVPALGQPFTLPEVERPRAAPSTSTSVRPTLRPAAPSNARQATMPATQSSAVFASANCAEAEASGLVNVPPDHPRYGPHLDTAEDPDLIGCNGNDAEPTPSETPTPIPSETEKPECPTNPDTPSNDPNPCTTSPPESPAGEPPSPSSSPQPQPSASSTPRRRARSTS